MPEKVRTVFADSDDENIVKHKLSLQSTEEPERKKKRSKKRKLDEREASKPADQDEPCEIPAPAKQVETTVSVPKKKPEAASHMNGPPASKTFPKSKPRPFADTKTNFTPLREKAKALLETRRKLPVFESADLIRELLREQDVMLLVGETGSGKSTQIPQFLVDEFWCRPVPTQITRDGKTEKKMVGGCIAITQPRRVAAISLARRVAEEMGTPLGSHSPASKVGYSVRFDTSTSPSTRVKFLTEGMLLQEMLHDPNLTKYSAIVVDEVHERGINVDLTLGFLRNLVSGKKEGRGGVPLKVVVMSATADMESLTDFFQAGFKHPEPKQKAIEGAEAETDKMDTSTPKDISVCRIKGRQFAVKTIYSPAPVHDFVDAALKIIFQIHQKEPMPGDILVFLTGQETVEALEHLVNEYAMSMDPSLPKILVLPLFAALPQAAQQRVFAPAPPRTRKVVLSTNIAETSVTVSGVRHVIDCGKAKVKQFRSRLGLDSLLVKPISKSAAIQRKGRAGREAPGQCFRLYTEKDYLALDETNTPEILRCDLSQALLNMKARGVDDIVGFPFLTRPPREALEKALLQLLNINALEDDGKISAVGLHIAKLPLTPTLGRVLLAGAENGHECLLDVIDIISCLSVENIFLNTTSEEKKEAAEAARRDLYRREGDHLTMLMTVRVYAAEHADRKAWAERHLVSHRAMQSVMDVRKQLRTQCRQAKLLTSEALNNTSLHDPSPILILQSFLAGFATNTARLVPDGSYRTIVGNQTVAIHPSSVLYGKKLEAIMYNEFVFTNRSYARGVSAVQMDWVGEALAGKD
ncbi:hypothetical protein N7447_006205 [Penicillium robsamsonii]|uniref:uncharacterized protein n=1 Tax=Penicillium robsamsonii TaxID=1792511 RepID=UPI002547CDED|nr:uncharacterized protein N7447_006205 [Penicillium robsamsonii]KAJ5823865.1 hypothetical protein N7447_006205 [Penicillium robsamsonii]